MPDPVALAGRMFPGGEYHLPGYISWLWSDCVVAREPSGPVHPSIAYMIGLHGGGASIADIMSMLGTAADSGVQFGEVDFVFETPLTADRTYRVDGEVLSVVRKEGKRTGPFDLATFVHRVREEEGGSVVATITHTWVIPRPPEAS